MTPADVSNLFDSTPSARSRLPAPPDLSIVVPMLDEEGVVDQFVDELGQVLDRLDLSSEIIAVDDGSRDGTFEALCAARRREPRLQVVRLARSYGQTAALAAGFEASRGAVVISIDADLQNDPRDIRRLLEALTPDVDVVSGWRQDRQDPWWSRRVPSLIANRVISWATGTRVHDCGCTLRAMRGHVARHLELYGEMHRFITPLAAEQGARIIEIPVSHRPRTIGTSKYGIGRTIRVVLDLLTVKFLWKFASRPMQLFGGVGVVLAGTGSVLLADLGFERIVLGTPIGGRPIVWLAILLVVVGVQLASMGLLGELIVRTRAPGSRPTFRVREHVGGRSNGVALDAPA